MSTLSLIPSFKHGGRLLLSRFLFVLHVDGDDIVDTQVSSEAWVKHDKPEEDSS